MVRLTPRGDDESRDADFDGSPGGGAAAWLVIAVVAVLVIAAVLVFPVVMRHVR